jgi:hypothetical protein
MAEPRGDRPPVTDRWSLARLARPWISLPLVSATSLTVLALAAGLTGRLLAELTSPLSALRNHGYVLDRFAIVVAVLALGLFFRARLAATLDLRVRRIAFSIGAMLGAAAAALSFVRLGLEYDNNTFAAAWTPLALTCAFLSAGVLAFSGYLRTWLPGALVGAAAMAIALLGLGLDASENEGHVQLWLELAFVWGMLAAGLWLGTTSRAGTDAGP